jgi:hypothetical protein
MRKRRKSGAVHNLHLLLAESVEFVDHPIKLRVCGGDLALYWSPSRRTFGIGQLLVQGEHSPNKLDAPVAAEPWAKKGRRAQSESGGALDNIPGQ